MGGYAHVEMGFGDISVLSPQFCCKLKTALLKHYVYKHVNQVKLVQNIAQVFSILIIVFLFLYGLFQSNFTFIAQLKGKYGDFPCHISPASRYAYTLHYHHPQRCIGESLYFFLLVIYLFNLLILRERRINLLFHLYIHPWVDSCMCSD